MHPSRSCSDGKVWIGSEGKRMEEGTEGVARDRNGSLGYLVYLDSPPSG